MKHLVSLEDVTTSEFERLLALSANVQAQPEQYRETLSGKCLAMIFQKSSTRTRVSFEAGMFQLGGHALYLSASDMQLGRGESLADTARVLSRYVNGIMARVYAHDDIVALARHSDVPVINGLSDAVHPCQAICDYFTMRQRFGALAGLRVVYVGDGNNMAHSLALGAAKLGVQFTIATPVGYEPDAEMIKSAQSVAAGTDGKISVTTDIKGAVEGAHVVYTDVWASMGQESEHQKRLDDFANYQVNGELFALASDDAIFMHCLPAHRGEEVTDEVADHARSVIFDQAENRLHTQKALLIHLLGE